MSSVAPQSSVRRVRRVDIRWLAVAALGLAVAAAALAGIIFFLLLDTRDTVTKDHTTVQQISRSPCANLTVQPCLDKLISHATPAQIARLRGRRGPEGDRGPRGMRGPRGE